MSALTPTTGARGAPAAARGGRARTRGKYPGKGLPILIVLRDLGEKDGEEKKSWDSSRGKSVAPELL
eukprot:COSAG02_NODE_772_length_17359_cov_74.661587_7_plen_67_part_00